MIKIDKCPCIDCLCLPVCKNKAFLGLVTECKIIDTYTHNTDVDYTVRAMEAVEDALRPTKWKYTFDEPKGEVVIEKKQIIVVKKMKEMKGYLKQVTRIP